MNKIYLSWLLMSLCFMFTGCESKPSSTEEKLEALGKEKSTFLKETETIKDEKLKKSIVGLANSIYLMEKIDISNESPPTRSAYENPDSLFLNNSFTPQELAKNYFDGLLGEQNLNKDTEIKLHVPFKYPFHQKHIIKSLTFDDGVDLLVVDDIDYDSDTLQATQVDNEVYVHYPDSGTINAILGSAEIELGVPASFSQFSFSINDIGQETTKNGFSIKLINIAEHYVEFEITLEEESRVKVSNDNLIVYAKDKTNQYLQYKGSLNTRSEKIEKFKDLLQESVKTINSDDDFKKKFTKLLTPVTDGKKVYYSKFYFKGIVDSVDIKIIDDSTMTTLKETIKFTIFSPVFDEDAVEIKTIPTSATVYDYPTNQMLNLQNLELQEAYEFNESIKKNYSVSGQQGEIEFKYPQVVSSLFLNAFDRYEQPKNLTFYKNNGESIDIPDGVNLKDVGYFRIKALEYDLEPFPNPSKVIGVRGTLPINTYPDIEIQSYSIDNLPEGIMVKNNMVIVDRNKYRGIKIYARDDTDTILKRITYINYGSKDGPNGRSRIHYYYGSPTSIQVLKKGKLIRVNYDFDLKL